MGRRLASMLDAIPVVSSTADRDLMFPTPDTNQRVHNLETASIQRWNGAAWLDDFCACPGGGPT